MDMLSVLLHEYGHVLGLDHSANPHDFMATTLTPGMRRLPTAEEFAQLSALANQANESESANSDVPSPTPEKPPLPMPGAPFGATLGALLFGRTRRTDSGGSSFTFDGWLGTTSAPQFSIAANPSLLNKEFDGDMGWSTTGTATFGAGAVTLSESELSQTRVNQVFALGEHDRFLSFTLDNRGMGTATGGPGDAFEVALLDATTGLSLAGTTGLTRNDALLNLQADGTEHKASTVTRTDNADGSSTYVVDLAAFEAGTVVNLSFDLIGFGQGSEAAVKGDINQHPGKYCSHKPE